jgi:hypothetical protein
LILHLPWSDGSTGPSTTSRHPQREPNSRPWRTDGTVDEGSLFVFRLGNPETPFGVGRLISRDNQGSLHFHWLSNYSDNCKGTFRHGWLDSKDNKVFYQVKLTPSLEKRCEPITGKMFDTHIIDEDVVVHSFELTAAHRLPAAVMRVISNDDRIGWAYNG